MQIKYQVYNLFLNSFFRVYLASIDSFENVLPKIVSIRVMSKELVILKNLFKNFSDKFKVAIGWLFTKYVKLACNLLALLAISKV